jgi:hypothetical protein
VTTSRTYGAVGDYYVYVTVTDSLGSVTMSPVRSVTAVSTNTAPVASRLAPVVSGMTASITDTSTDAEDAQNALVVIVDCGNSTTVTGAGGTALVCTYTSTGTYTIRHSVKDTGGLSSSSANVSVTVSSVKYRVTGMVTKQNGTRIAYATLNLQVGGVTKYAATSSSTGTFSFGSVLPGTYTVKATKTGLTFTLPAESVPSPVVVSTSDVTGVVVKSVQ